METPKTTFRLDTKTLKMMDRVITHPTEFILDGVRGAPRNRTELIEVLVRKAAEKLAEHQQKAQ